MFNDRRSENGGPKKSVIDERKLECVVKGIANVQRIRILQLVESDQSLSLRDVCEILELDYANGCEHIKKMVLAGMVIKRRRNSSLCHLITGRGRQALLYLRSVI